MLVDMIKCSYWIPKTNRSYMCGFAFLKCGRFCIQEIYSKIGTIKYSNDVHEKSLSRSYIQDLNNIYHKLAMARNDHDHLFKYRSKFLKKEVTFKLVTQGYN